MDNTYKLQFKKTYVILCLVIFLVEIIILKTSGFIRFTLGDFLAVMVVYFFVKSFYNIAPIHLGIYVLLFSYSIEFLQLINFFSITFKVITLLQIIVIFNRTFIVKKNMPTCSAAL